MRTCTLHLPAGFGEVASIWAKLSTVRYLPEYPDIHFEAYICPDDPRGCLEFCSLLPGLEVKGYGKHSTHQILANAVPPEATLAELLPGPIYPALDYWLIRGNSLSDWMPELPVNYHYPIEIPHSCEQAALEKIPDGDFVLVYPSSHHRLRRGYWGNVWGLAQWADLLVRLKKITTCPVYAIGTMRDAAMLKDLVRTGAVSNDRALCVASLAETLTLIRRAAYFVGFPAGPSVVAGVLGTPHCILFRDQYQRHMRGTFTDPEMIKAGTSYQPLFSESPGVVSNNLWHYLPGKVRGEPCEVPPMVTGVEEDLWPPPLQPSPDGQPARAAYELARSARPRYLLSAGDSVSLVAALRGTLDAGTPVKRIVLVGAPMPTEVYTLSQRVSPRPEVLEYPDIQAARRPVLLLTDAPGYGMIILGQMANPEYWRWGWSILGCPGVILNGSSAYPPKMGVDYLVK